MSRPLAKIGDIKEYVRDNGSVDTRIRTETGWKFIATKRKGKHLYSQQDVDYIKENLVSIGVQECANHIGVSKIALYERIRMWRKSGIAIPYIKIVKVGTIKLRSGGSWKGKKLMQKTEKGWKYIRTTRSPNVKSALLEPQLPPVKEVVKEKGYKNCGKHKREPKKFLTTNGTYIKTKTGYKKVDTITKKKEEKQLIKRQEDLTNKTWIRLDKRTVVLRKKELLK